LKNYKNIGHRIIHLPVIDSTNNYLTMLFNKGDINHGCVIMADKQTRGRGQRDSNWESEDGKNIMFSLCIEPQNFPVLKQFDISCFTSICIINFLNEIGISAKIKWPNDIMVHDQKIAGILIENQLTGKNIKLANIGIGININQINFNILNATSLIKELKSKRDISKDKSLIIEHLNIGYNTFFYNHNELRKEYLEHLYQYKITAKYKSKNGFFLGEITGISDWGKLRVKVDGQIIEFDNKEIEYI